MTSRKVRGREKKEGREGGRRLRAYLSVEVLGLGHLWICM